MDPIPPSPPPPPPPNVPPPPPYGAEPLRPTWFQRNKTWAIPVGCLLAIVTFGCCGVLGAAVYGWDKVTNFYAAEKKSVATVEEEVRRLVEENAKVRAELGEPVNAEVAMKGYSNTNGVARVRFEIIARGPNGEADGRGEARRDDSAQPWDIGPVTLNLSEETIQLAEGTFSEDTEGEAPWPGARRERREDRRPPAPPAPPPAPGSSGSDAPRPPDDDPFKE